jgi:hypothetical protein
MMFFHSIGALAKSTTAGFCFHLANVFLLPIGLSWQTLLGYRVDENAVHAPCGIYLATWLRDL